MSQFAGKPTHNLETGYTFDILGYDQWPSVSIRYNFAIIDGNPNLQLHFKFDGSGYDAIGEKAVDDLTVFKNIYYQLNWQYTTDDKPDEAVNFLAHSASCSILSENLSFTDQQSNALKNFVSVIISWLEVVITPGEDGLPDSPSTMVLSLPITGEQEVKDIFELNVALNITRKNPDDVTHAAQYSKIILPAKLLGEHNAFAENFEAIFASADSKLKLATGLSAINSNNAQQLWVIRMADTAGAKGIYYDIIIDNPVAFAPMPLSTTLLSGDVKIREYISKAGINWNKQGHATTFENIDLDNWLQHFLTAIDDVLSPEKSEVINLITNTYDKIEQGKFAVINDLLIAKDAILEKLSDLLIQVIPGQDGNLSNARHHLKSQLNNSLAALYTGTATMQFKTHVASADGTGDFELLGSIQPAVKSTDASFSNTGIKSDPEGFTSFTVFATSPAQQRYLPVNVNYKLENVLYTVNDSTVITLHFLIDPASVKPLSATVPLVLRSYPGPSQILSQLTEKMRPDSVKLTDVKLFNYQYHYNGHLNAQDVLETRVALNPVKNISIGLTRPRENTLLQSLAQFITSYTLIKAELDEYLPLVTAKTDINSDTYHVVTSALVTFSELVNSIKPVLSLPQTLTSRATIPTQAAYSFELAEGLVTLVTDPRLLITVSATKNEIGKYALPLVSLQGYTTKVHSTTTNETGSVTAYTFSDANGEALLVTDKYDLSEFTISGFDVLEVQQLATTTVLNRNKNLLPNSNGGYLETDSRLIYNIPQNSALPVEPFLDWGTEFNLADLRTTTANASIKEYVLLLLTQLFGNVSDTAYNISVNASYEYKLTPDDFMTVTLPVFLVNDMEFEFATNKGNDVAGQFESTIKAWQEATQAEQGAGARFVFDISVFTSLRPNRAILRVQNIYLNLSDVN
ncbi:MULTISPECIES: hypothetical protein [unclassified Mucilaginibacter]|uniref:hypothetical protein n=1 Tax=unclassified Mucilaginibacter TaxID=2617802 RepID=UPI002AC9B274|nr:MULTISPECIES: hypothetical protein [unclassified Mucilaginibacter]MEB0262689.1 hypothetical protein [Mucilaginibacter sp. 10I4]MEB0279473.1 hypothetical protein [Mucilaginibacter sp. 10B2]MEB0300034.1 hypothetical protein [Mucilaginibacter sp. 5C4]WPX21847.1 hypothetical protein RHM67_11170 [Mucilaginibacter sp. 5C4]